MLTQPAVHFLSSQRPRGVEERVVLHDCCVLASVTRAEWGSVITGDPVLEFDD
jgi:hypothetical protein